MVHKRTTVKPKKMLTKLDRQKLIRDAIQARKMELLQQKKVAKSAGRPKKIVDPNLVKKKKWRDKDKRMLLEQVKEKYLAIRKMRFNILRVDPMVNEQKRF